jgi:NRAMP (natural resistance-associated macrophage protein)-like metal ion transporter
VPTSSGGVDTTTAAAKNPVWRQYLRAIGPGLVTGASDDDPSAIVTYASAGAKAGYGLLWTCTVSFPLMIAVQINADRTALATGRSLGELASERFGGLGRRLFVLLLVAHVLANTLVIAADLIAVGEGIRLLVGGPVWLWPLAAGVGISALLLSGSFAAIANVLKVLCLALVGYVAAVFVVDVDWGAVASNLLVPRIRTDPTSLGLTLAVLGATLPPYVFFWQSVHRLEELREEEAGGDEPLPLTRRPRGQARRKRHTSALDVVCGMAFAVIVMFAVMVTTAATGTDEVESAADVASALEPVAGSAAKALFAAGFVAAGILAVPVLAGAGSAAVAGYLRRDWGFSRSPRQAPVFYGLVGAGTIGGMVLTLVGVDAIQLLVAAATLNGATSAPLLAVVMLISGDRQLLGPHRPGRVLRVLGWAAVAMMAAAALGGLLSAL